MAGSEALGPTTATSSFFESLSFEAGLSMSGISLDLGGAFGGGGGGGAPMPADP